MLRASILFLPFDDPFSRNYVGSTLLNYTALKLVLQIAVYLQFPRRSPEAAGRQRLSTIYLR